MKPTTLVILFSVECGSAINKSCDDNNTIGFLDSDSQSRDDEEDMEIFYWSLAATYGVTLMVIVVFLCFDSLWRRAWFRRVDAFINVFDLVYFRWYIVSMRCCFILQDL